MASSSRWFPEQSTETIRRPQQLAEVHTFGPGSGLANWLEALAMEPADFYGVRGAGFTSLRRELGWLPVTPHPQEESLSRAIGAGLLHLDDPDRLRATAQLCGTGKRWRPLPEALALLWQASAWRDELRQLLHLLADRTERRLHPAAPGAAGAVARARPLGIVSGVRVPSGFDRARAM